MPNIMYVSVPCTYSWVAAVDTALDTLHMYCPPSLPVTVRVWVYSAVTPLTTSLLLTPTAVCESLVQVTVVAGPPVEIQVRVNSGLATSSRLNVTLCTSTTPEMKSHSMYIHGPLIHCSYIPPPLLYSPT